LAMIRRHTVLLILTALLSAPGTAVGQQKSVRKNVLPLTSRSPEARRITERAMVLALDEVQQTQAIGMLRNACSLDPDFAMAHDPNPHDSYAEILRMAGRFEDAVKQYQAALAIDPSFYSSQFGIADTYSLMGDQIRARKEYAVGFQRFSLPELHKVLWQTRE